MPTARSDYSCSVYAPAVVSRSSSAMTSACDFQQHSVRIDREGRGRMDGESRRGKGLHSSLALKQDALEEESA